MSFPASPLRLLPTVATFVGWDSHPLKFRAFSRRTFASSVKVDWSVSHEELLGYAEEVALSTKKTLEEQGFDEWKDLPLFAANGNPTTTLKELPAERSKILLKDSISPRPLHKALVLLDAIDRHGNHQLQRYGRLCFANALVHRISNLKFGPEVGVGKIKYDAPVVDAWLECIRTAVRDVHRYGWPDKHRQPNHQRRRSQRRKHPETGFRRFCNYLPAISEREGLHENDPSGIRCSRLDKKPT